MASVLHRVSFIENDEIEGSSGGDDQDELTNNSSAIRQIQTEILNLHHLTKINDRILVALEKEDERTNDPDAEQEQANEIELRERLDNLAIQLLDSSATRFCKEKAIKSSLLGNMIFKKFASQDEENDSGEKLKHDNLDKLMENIIFASDNHMDQKEKVESLMEKLVGRQKRHLELMIRSRKLYHESCEVKKELDERKLLKNTADIKRLKTVLKENESNETTLKCLYQEIVLFSKQNWSESDTIYNVLTRK